MNFVSMPNDLEVSVAFGTLFTVQALRKNNFFILRYAFNLEFALTTEPFFPFVASIH